MPAADAHRGAHDTTERHIDGTRGDPGEEDRAGTFRDLRAVSCGASDEQRRVVIIEMPNTEPIEILLVEDNPGDAWEAAQRTTGEPPCDLDEPAAYAESSRR